MPIDRNHGSISTATTQEVSTSGGRHHLNPLLLKLAMAVEVRQEVVVVPVEEETITLLGMKSSTLQLLQPKCGKLSLTLVAKSINPPKMHQLRSTCGQGPLDLEILTSRKEAECVSLVITDQTVP